MAVQLLFCGVLLPGFVHCSSKHSCALSVLLFLYTLCPSVHVVHRNSSIETTVAWKKFRFNLSSRSEFHIIDSLSTAVHAFTRRILILISIDKMLLSRYVNFSTNFRERLFREEMAPSWLKCINSVLYAFPLRLIPPAVCSMKYVVALVTSDLHFVVYVLGCVQNKKSNWPLKFGHTEDFSDPSSLRLLNMANESRKLR